MRSITVAEKFAVFTQVANTIDMQDATWSLIDDALVDFYQSYATLIGAGSYIMAGTVLDQTRAGLEKFLDSKPEYVLKADSLEELAQKMGFSGETYGVNLSGSTQSLGLTFGMIVADHACGV